MRYTRSMVAVLTHLSQTFRTSDYQQVPTAEERARAGGHFSAETRGFPSADGPAMQVQLPGAD
eukprot:8273615-Lingulodinium_polyedra.AAC.1